MGIKLKDGNVVDRPEWKTKPNWFELIFCPYDTFLGYTGIKILGVNRILSGYKALWHFQIPMKRLEVLLSIINQLFRLSLRPRVSSQVQILAGGK
jgi:hypothetical protein